MPEAPSTLEKRHQSRRSARHLLTRTPRDGTARRRLAARSAIGLTVVVSVMVAAACWVTVRGMDVRDHLQRAAALAQQLRQELESGDPAVTRTLTTLQRETRAARAGTDHVGWRIAGRAPFAGDNLTAVRTVAVALDELAQHGLPPLVESAATMRAHALAPTNGQITLEPLQRTAPRLAVADDAVRRARARIATIPAGNLVRHLRAAVADLRRSLDVAAADTATATRTATLLPPMLGVEGPRTYLVLFQNLAEVRATGGMPGAYVVLVADRGTIKIVDQGTAAGGLRTFDAPVLPLDPAMRNLYTDRIGRFPANVNATPHFPTAAALAREMYRRRSGRTVDGVLATDPVALAYLLSALGPVPVPHGPPLQADSVVQLLLSDTYSRFASSAEQDHYFAAAARATFQALMQRPLRPPALVAQLAKAAGERRILVWSANPTEQRTLSGTVLDGTLPDSDPTRPTVGVFLNDGSGAKLGYYLTHSADLAVGGCRAERRQELNLRITLGSTAPPSGLPPGVLGLGLAGDPYTARTFISIFSPAGGSLVNVRLDGAPTPFSAGTERGRSVGLLTVDLKPGQTRTIEVTLLTDKPTAAWGGTLSPRLWVTPGVNPWPGSVRSADACRPPR